MLCLSSRYVNCVAFKPDNPNIVVSGSCDKTIKTWDITSGSCLSTLRGENAIFSLAFSPDGQLIATGEGNPYNASAAGAVRIYCASTGQVKRALNVDAGIGGVQSVSFSPSGDMVAAGCFNGKIHFMDAAAGQIKSSVTGHTRYFFLIL